MAGPGLSVVASVLLPNLCGAGLSFLRRKTTLHSQVPVADSEIPPLKQQTSPDFSQTKATRPVGSGWLWTPSGRLSSAPETPGLPSSLPMGRSCRSPRGTETEISMLPLKLNTAKDGSQTEAVTTDPSAWPRPPWAASHLHLKHWGHVFLPN